MPYKHNMLHTNLLIIAQCFTYHLYEWKNIWALKEDTLCIYNTRSSCWTKWKLILNVEPDQRQAPRSHKTLMFVCPKKMPNNATDITKLDCTVYSGRLPEQWVQSTLVTSQTASHLFENKHASKLDETEHSNEEPCSLIISLKTVEE